MKATRKFTFEPEGIFFFFYFLKTKNYLAADLVRCRKKSSPKNWVLIRFFFPTILLLNDSSLRKF